MLDLSPTKLLIIFVVMIVLLGPKRLPQVARQLGAAWRTVVGFQRQVEGELRQSMPDLPSTQDIARFARSPLTMLNELADMSGSSSYEQEPEPELSPPLESPYVENHVPSPSPPPSEPLSPSGSVETRPSSLQSRPSRPADPVVLGDLSGLAVNDPAMN